MSIRDRGATLRWGGAPLVTQYWGGTKHFFILTILGGGACAPQPPLLYGPCPWTPLDCLHIWHLKTPDLSVDGALSNDYYDCGVVNLMHLSDEREPWGGEGDKQEFGQSQRNKSLISWEQDMIFWLNSVKILINGGWNLSCQISYPQFKEKYPHPTPPLPLPPPIHIQPY